MPSLKMTWEMSVETVEALTHHGRSAALEENRAPTLLLYGGDDRLNWPKLGREISAKLAGAHFLKIPGAAHL